MGARAQPDSTTAVKMTTYFNYPEPALQEELKRIANQITAPGKGILAADESGPTMGKRLADVGLENTDENRRKYRQLLFSFGRALQASVLKAWQGKDENVGAGQAQLM